MQDPVASIVASVAGHLALDPHLCQEVPFDIAKRFGAKRNHRHCPVNPPKARFARIRTTDRLAMIELAAKTWLAGESPEPADMCAVVGATVSRLVPGGPDGLADPSRSDVQAYFWLGNKKTKVKDKVDQLNSRQQRELTTQLTQLLDSGRAVCVPQPGTLPPTADDEEPFDPNNKEDTRERTERTTTQRDGQTEFRESIISAYAGKCAITACSILAVLEAVHIIPYRGAHTDKISNGLLLRVDLHRLFDRKLLAIDPETMEVLLAPHLEDSEYKIWCGRRIRLPKNTKAQPNTEALRMHLEACRNAWGE